jgi:hypothetical protein
MSRPQPGATARSERVMETTLIFHDGLDLPHVAAFTLLASVTA